MHWWRPACIVDAPWQPTLVYPARGLASPWQASRRVDAALGAVVGRTRATLLAALDAPRSTTELASALGLSAGGVSAHLTALRNGELVSSTRHGHSVLYARPPYSRPAPDAAGRHRNRPELSRRAAEIAVDRTVAYRKARKGGAGRAPDEER
jgi:DNA-binding transcriptional ArsR family regulator